MKKKVLIIGETILGDNILALEAADIEVATAQSYPQGLQKLDETSPDLVIIDEILPTVDGQEACFRLRQISDIPIILLSADRRGQAVARALNQGVDTYIFKPFSSRELEARINALLRRCQRKVNDDSRVKGSREQILDPIDKLTDKESTLHINMEDVGGRFFGCSLRPMGKVVGKKEGGYGNSGQSKRQNQ